MQGVCGPDALGVRSRTLLDIFSNMVASVDVGHGNDLLFVGGTILIVCTAVKFVFSDMVVSVVVGHGNNLLFVEGNILIVCTAVKFQIRFWNEETDNSYPAFPCPANFTQNIIRINCCAKHFAFEMCR